MKRTFVIPLVLVFALLFVVPVSAAPPVIVTGQIDENYPPFDPSPCADFLVMDHEVATYRQISYFDNQGNLLRITMHVQGVDSFYNPANPDKVLSGSFSGTLEVDLNTGELVLASGLAVHITAPGYGMVLQRAGRWLRYPNSQLGGKDSLLVPTDIAQFCSLLADD
jgi:hypothetical protein